MKPTRNAHTAPTGPKTTGMGDYYGTGIRQKVGRMREDSVGMNQVKGKRLSSPPKKLA